MATKWCHNAKTGEIFSYEVEGNLTDFPRGVLLAYGNYITTGFNSKEEAEVWAKEYGICEMCKSTRSAAKQGKCIFCGTEIIFNKYKIV